jgi:glycosyltransferase involved in cell wall biosynthesis
MRTAKAQRNNPDRELPDILMVMLCMHCTIGGAEKQYARVFELLSTMQAGKHHLLINRAMLDLLLTTGLLSDVSDSLIILDPPFRKLSQSNHLLQNRFFSPLLAALDVLWYCWQCWRTIRDLHPDVVHPLLTGVYFCLPAMLANPRVGFMLSAYSYQFESYRDKRIFGIPVGATLKRFAMQRCQLIDALTYPIRDDLVVRGIDPGKIRVAPGPFTDFSLCQPAEVKRPWVVFLGRFVSIKNPLLLIDAIPAVLDQFPETHFYFLGSGDLQDEMERQVQASRVSEYVTIRFEPEPAQILNESSIFVSLQSEENYPSQSLLEAMACANAVVATDVGETWRLVNEKNGMRVSSTAEAVAQAIIQLFHNQGLRRLGDASRQQVLESYSAERYFDYILAAYKYAAGQKL